MGEFERLIGAGTADGIDFEGVETAARRLALEVMGKTVAARLDAAQDVRHRARRDRIGARLPLSALVDQFYAEVQAMGGGRWDTSSLMRLLTRT